MTSIRKILIVEDELLIAKVLRMQLEGIGFEVANVVDGHQALDFIKKSPPDLIILDNYLKNELTGVEVGQQIRAWNILIPIIFVTGNSYQQTKEQTSTILHSSVLSKPVIFEQLIDQINKL